MLAIAIEECGLHRRIALSAMSLVGTAPRFLMLGFMVPTALLSMWISNTATTAMMLPIMEAVLAELGEKSEHGSDQEKVGLKNRSEWTLNLNCLKIRLFKGTDDVDQSEYISLENVGASKLSVNNDSGERNLNSTKEGYEDIDLNSNNEDAAVSKPKLRDAKRSPRLRPLFALSIAFSANVGGTGTIIGTPPNLVLMEYLDDFDGQPLAFASWMGFAMPQVLLSLVMTWLWLQLYFLGLPKRSSGEDDAANDGKGRGIRKIIRKKRQELGPMSYHEASVLFFFCILLCLWLFRSPGFMTGWADLLVTYNAMGDKVTVSDATPAFLIVIIMFVMPAKPTFLNIFRANNAKLESSPALVSWKSIQEKLPWNILLLLGKNQLNPTIDRT